MNDFLINAVQSPFYDHHELVEFIDDEASGLRAIIAVHNTHRGPAVGGCRMFPYANVQEALDDVLRLSRGMTYKSALAGLPMGGGKAVIIGDPAVQKTPELFIKMAEFINSFNGRYIVAEDSGISVDDLKIVAKKSQYVLGINESQQYGGDPSPLTAHGVFCGIRSAIKFKFNHSDFSKIKVAVQGAGSVGRHLIKALIEAGAQVWVSDINHANLIKAQSLGAKVCSVDEVMTLDVDVFAPCAMGAILNDRSIANLKATIVAGGANNQLAESHHAQQLHNSDILYAPDYVINAGGIIEICRQFKDQDTEASLLQIEAIEGTLTTLFQISVEKKCPTALVADLMAEQSFSSVSKPDRTLNDRLNTELNSAA